MKTIKKSDLHIIGHLKGITQYELKNDTTALVLELSGKFYISHSKGMYDYQDNLIKRVCGCYSNDYDSTLLGEKVEIVKDE